MNYKRLKKITVSLCLTLVFILSSGLTSTSLVQAQGRGQWRREQRREQQWERWQRQQRIREEREALNRIRRLDRDRQLRYRYNNSLRVVGYYDYFGRFHAVGYYDRFGLFRRY